MTMRCFVWMRLYRCKIFARWVYKHTNARDDMTMRCFRRCDQKIARFSSHLSEYRLGPHIGQTIYKILAIILYLDVCKKWFNQNPSKTDECPPNIYKMNVRIRTANFGKRPLDGLWLKDFVQFLVCWFSGMLCSFVTTLQDDTKHSSMRGDVLVFWDAKFMLPKRRFSKTEKHFGPSFWALFQGFEY
jgi:hypothetical protein